VSEDGNKIEAKPQRSRLLTAIAESVIGLALAALVLWALIVSVTDAEFVYQGF